MIGKKNMAFGFLYFVTTLGLGMFLASKLGDPEFAKTMQRGLLKAAHVHGNLESFLNIAIGYLLCRLSLEAWIAKTASWLLIVAAVFHSGMLYLGGLGVAVALKLTPIGAIALITAMLLMAIGVIKLKSVD